MIKTQKKIVSELVFNDRIQIVDKTYFLVDTKIEMGQSLFQSLDGSRKVIDFEEEVDFIYDAVRGFDPVDESHRRINSDFYLPERKTESSAGYDFKSPCTVIIRPGDIVTIWTNVKAYMLKDEELRLSIRSGLGSKGLLLMNGIGVVDADYYSNVDNDGNIGFCFMNTNPVDFIISAGDRIGQGVFSKYLLADGDNATGVREGGFGSTGR